MKKILMVPLLCAAMLLQGCMPLLAGLMGSAPAPQAVQNATAPLAHTTVDETAVRGLYQSLDTVRAAVDVLVQTHQVVRNSPAALRIRAGLIAARDAINAADDLVQLLNSPVTTLSADAIAQRIADYRTAMRSAAAAFTEISAAIRER